MSKLPLDKRNKILMVAAATLVTSAVLWFLLIRPLQASLSNLHHLVRDAREQVDRGTRTIAAGKNVAGALESASARLKTAEAAMASGDLYAWMIQTLNQFKLSYTVDIPQISREMPCDVGVLPQFPYKAASFIARGTAYYHDLGKFLAGLENSFPYARLQNLELEPIYSLKGDEEERLSFKFELVTLIKPLTP
jgi:hypothetical protein